MEPEEGEEEWEVIEPVDHRELPVDYFDTDDFAEVKRVLYQLWLEGKTRLDVAMITDYAEYHRCSINQALQLLGIHRSAFREVLESVRREMSRREHPLRAAG